jgi:signal transduction histidine kinase
MTSEPKPQDLGDVELIADDFDLVKYFSMMCLILFVVMTTIMCIGFYFISKQYIRVDTEHHAIPIADWFSTLAFVEGHPFPASGSPAFAALDKELREALRPLAIFKVKIYDPEKRIVYTTDSRVRTGRLDLENTKLNRALNGEVVSSLQTSASLWDLDEEERRTGAFVEAYVPVRRTGRLVGVMEIYQDVTSTYDRLPAVVAMIVAASILAMGTLYGSLFLIVRRAHATIRAQTRTIRKAKANLETYATELERRVEERTRQLRESLVQQQQDEKMIATGTLAAGVAHELNTPLGTILGSVQMVLEQCSRVASRAADAVGLVELRKVCDACRDDLGRIESQARRCKEFIGGLVDFSRKSDSERGWERLTNLIEQSIRLVQPNAGQKGIEVIADLDDDVPPLLVNGNEIQQVLVNLMNNGIDAMPDGGVVTLRLRRRNETAVIEVRDTGMGMDDEAMQRIFEPFFTTKEVGKGTGLGLSISYRIVKDHGGRIYVSSTPGKGSTFTVELPIHAEPDEAVSADRGTPPDSAPEQRQAG